MVFVVVVLGFSCPSFAADFRNSVVEIIATLNPYDYTRPWQSQGLMQSGGSGAIIEGHRILTNAHVINHATYVEVRKYSDPKRYTAKVIAVGHDCDLALLTVDDPEFFKDTLPLKFDGVPQVQDTVQVVGFPIGGNEISVTKGVVSRIEVTFLVYSLNNLLTIQIDAALNPGNSGGPAIKNGKMIGIATQAMGNADNIGYIIPVPIIERFLDDLKDGAYNGMPFAGFGANSTENGILRQYYGIDKKTGGIIINRVMPFSSADGILKEGDIILAIDGVAIAQDGSYKFRKNERLQYTHLITQKQVGDEIKLSIVRDKKEQTLTLKLKIRDLLVKDLNTYSKPRYFIYGGLVFSVLTVDLLKTMAENKANNIEWNYYALGSGRLNYERKKELAVLLDVLPGDINRGYSDFTGMIISKINGKPVGTFKDLVMALKAKEGEYTIIEGAEGGPIILKNSDIDAATQKILLDNDIPAQYSDDVAKWLDK